MILFSRILSNDVIRFLPISNFTRSCFSTKIPKRMPPKILNVAEKNDAAKSIAQIMSTGHSQRREGFSQYNKIYEFDYRIFGQVSKMCMTSVSGHLLALDFSGQYRNWRGCDPLMLFEAPVRKFCPENFANIKRTLEREIRNSSKLIIWTDGDREGENIGCEIIEVCQAVKPAIPVYRARFSEITRPAIERAIANLEQPKQAWSDAVDVRQELDLRIGAAFTRFQTLRLQRIFPQVIADSLVSYGSCQFPTLGFVVERYKEIAEFVTEPFWKIQVEIRNDDGLANFNWERIRLFDELACLAIFQNCVEEPLARVVDIQQKNKSKWRPVALDTVEMEKLASRKLHINARETMKIAEKLYTQGFISYPRTETNIFPKGIDLRNLVQIQTNDPNWGQFAQQVLQWNPNPRNGRKTDNAHPPIHPTRYTDTLQGNERRVYEFIVRHFLACLSQDAQGFETKVEIELAGERFHSSGLMVVARNYLDVYPYENWNDRNMPNFRVGDEHQPSKLEMTQGRSEPPNLLTEADLITLMEKHGIGTDATHAEHIEKIKTRAYVGVRGDGKLLPGELGMGLVEGYDSMGFEMSKPNLRADFESDLKLICDGRKDKDVVLREQVQKYREVFVETVRQAEKIDGALGAYFGDPHQRPPGGVGGGPPGGGPGGGGDGGPPGGGPGGGDPPRGGGPFGGGGGPQDPRPPSPPAPHQPPLGKCPCCGLHLTLKQKKDTTAYFVGCMGFPECKAVVWLPRSVENVTVLDETCSCRTPYKKLRILFKSNARPPGLPADHTGCVFGCDTLLAAHCNMSGLDRPSTTPSASQISSTQIGPAKRKKAQLGGGGLSQTQSRGLHSRVLNSMGNVSSSPRSRRGGRSGRGGKKNGMSSSPYQRSSAFKRGRGRRGGRKNRGRGSFSGSQHTQAPSGGTITCECGDAPKMLSVRKETANKGRSFYKCSKDVCRFFAWADEQENAAPAQNSGGGGGSMELHDDDVTFSVSGPGASDFWQQQNIRRQNDFQVASTSTSMTNIPPPPAAGPSASNNPLCACNNPSKVLTVKKNGPNQGRAFYACPLPQGEGCGFFEWADQGGNAQQSNGAPLFSSSSVRGKWKGKGQGTKRKCGQCGVVGHTKKTCTQGQQQHF